MNHYVLVIHGDVEPELVGPYPNAGQRDRGAKEMRLHDPESKNGLYAVDAAGTVEVNAYSGGFFEPCQSQPAS
jgi:hypothetical protein